jgi:hypothetical protein
MGAFKGGAIYYEIDKYTMITKKNFTFLMLKPVRFSNNSAIYGGAMYQ